jgi:hypothetical protein
MELFGDRERTRIKAERKRCGLHVVSKFDLVRRMAQMCWIQDGSTLCMCISWYCRDVMSAMGMKITSTSANDSSEHKRCPTPPGRSMFLQISR